MVKDPFEKAARAGHARGAGDPESRSRVSHAAHSHGAARAQVHARFSGETALGDRGGGAQVLLVRDRAHLGVPPAAGLPPRYIHAGVFLNKSEFCFFIFEPC